MLHTGVEPVHCVLLVAEHTPHPPDGWHAGVEPLQSTSAAHPRQLPVVVLQVGVVPVHCAVLVAEHCPHAPED